MIQIRDRGYNRGIALEAGQNKILLNPGQVAMLALNLMGVLDGWTGQDFEDGDE